MDHTLLRSGQTNNDLNISETTCLAKGVLESEGIRDIITHQP